MKNKSLKISVFFIIFLGTAANDFVIARNDSLIEKEITAEPYRLFLTNNDYSFFSGSLEIFDKYNNSVFYADSFYTRYNRDTLIDLDNDGNKEFILDVGTGATMYDYNMFLIFDFTKSPAPLFEIHNAELNADAGGSQGIISYERLSPAVMGAGFAYNLKYENGKIVLDNDAEINKELKDLEPDESDERYLIKEYEAGFDECADDSQILTYYQAYIIQQKILGQESKGWKFFDKYYKCKNKKNIKASLKKIVDESYNFLSNSQNYKFVLNKY